MTALFRSATAPSRFALATVVVAVVVAVFAGPASAGEGWLTDYEQAVKLSKATQRPILADFTGSDWCFWCKRLAKEVFETPEFKAWAKEKVVLLTVDFPSDPSTQTPKLRAQNKRLQEKYAIDGYPTIVVLDAQGKELGRLGYEEGGPSKWLASADPIVAKAGRARSAASRWTDDYQAAVAKAQATGKVVLAEFTGSDWCGWCVRLEKEVFETPEFEAWAAKTVILLELDYPLEKPQTEGIKAQNKALLKKYGVSGYPTILLINGEGEVVGKLGYERGGPTPWIRKAQALIDAAAATE